MSNMSECVVCNRERPHENAEPPTNTEYCSLACQQYDEGVCMTDGCDEEMFMTWKAEVGNIHCLCIDHSLEELRAYQEEGIRANRLWYHGYAREEDVNRLLRESPSDDEQSGDAEGGGGVLLGNQQQKEEDTND